MICSFHLKSRLVITKQKGEIIEEYVPEPLKTMLQQRQRE